MTLTLENAILNVQPDARYDLRVNGPDGREYHVTGAIPEAVRDIHLARGIFQAMADGILRLYYPTIGAV